MFMIILILNLIQLINFYLKFASCPPLPNPDPYPNFICQFEHYSLNRANITHMPYTMRRKF